METLAKMAIFAAFVKKWGQGVVLKAFEVFETCEKRGFPRDVAVRALAEASGGLVSIEEMEALSEAYDNIGAESLAEARGET